MPECPEQDTLPTVFTRSSDKVYSDKPILASFITAEPSSEVAVGYKMLLFAPPGETFVRPHLQMHIIGGTDDVFTILFLGPRLPLREHHNDSYFKL
jgi:hypothetical protein